MQHPSTVNSHVVRTAGDALFGWIGWLSLPCWCDTLLYLVVRPSCVTAVLSIAAASTQQAIGWNALLQCYQYTCIKQVSPNAYLSCSIWTAQPGHYLRIIEEHQVSKQITLGSTTCESQKRMSRPAEQQVRNQDRPTYAAGFLCEGKSTGVEPERLPLPVQ